MGFSIINHPVVWFIIVLTRLVRLTTKREKFWKFLQKNRATPSYHPLILHLRLGFSMNFNPSIPRLGYPHPTDPTPAARPRCRLRTQRAQRGAAPQHRAGRSRGLAASGVCAGGDPTNQWWKPCRMGPPR